MTKLVYVATPIDQVAGAELSHMAALHAAVQQAGWVAYLPHRAFDVPPGTEPDRRIRQVNHRAMSVADGVIAWLPLDTPSIGVPMEIERATSGWGMPVVVYGKAAEASWMLAEMPGVTVVSSLEEAIGALDRQMSEQRPQRTSPLRFQVGDQGGRLPTRTHEGDAGFDLYVSERTYIPLGEFVDVPHDIAVELPYPYWGRITGRSSTLRKRGLLVVEGIIDQGYRGPLFTGVFALQRDMTLEPGDRISQLIPQSLAAHVMQPAQVSRLAPSDRGEAGFGSTGT